MDWNEIKENHPKSYQVWQQWLKLHCSSDYWDNFWKELNDIDVRVLYDFFDEQGIYVIINHSPADKEFFYTIDINMVCIDGDYYKTRTKAEEQAFLKAFKILEDRI